MRTWLCSFYRDDYYNKDTENKNMAEIIIAKQRNGPIGTNSKIWYGCRSTLGLLTRKRTKKGEEIFL